MQPTDEQIKWFWEQIGCEYTEISCLGKPWFNIYPTIDLANLFKYAVSKLDNWEMYKQPDGVFVEVSLNDAHEIRRVDKDPALAIFWAIYKALGGKVDGI